VLGGARYLIAGGNWALHSSFTVFAPILIIAAAAFSTLRVVRKVHLEQCRHFCGSPPRLATLRNSLVIP
jgi:hypothetical protein